MHVVYRNLDQRDTIFGLDIIDILVLGISMMLLFRFNDSPGFISRGINLSLMAVIYLTLVYTKRHLPKGYFQHMLDFLFKPRILLPDREQQFNLMDGDDERK